MKFDEAVKLAEGMGIRLPSWAPGKTIRVEKLSQSVTQMVTYEELLRDDWEITDFSFEAWLRAVVKASEKEFQDLTGRIRDMKQEARYNVLATYRRVLGVYDTRAGNPSEGDLFLQYVEERVRLSDPELAKLERWEAGNPWKDADMAKSYDMGFLKGQRDLLNEFKSRHGETPDE